MAIKKPAAKKPAPKKAPVKAPAKAPAAKSKAAPAKKSAVKTVAGKALASKKPLAKLPVVKKAAAKVLPAKLLSAKGKTGKPAAKTKAPAIVKAVKTKAVAVKKAVVTKAKAVTKAVTPKPAPKPASKPTPKAKAKPKSTLGKIANAVTDPDRPRGGGSRRCRCLGGRKDHRDHFKERRSKNPEARELAIPVLVRAVYGGVDSALPSAASLLHCLCPAATPPNDTRPDLHDLDQAHRRRRQAAHQLQSRRCEPAHAPEVPPGRGSTTSTAAPIIGCPRRCPCSATSSCGRSNRLNPDERRVIMRNLGFFSTAESLVGNNIVLAIFKHVTNPECRQFLLRQAFEEADPHAHLPLHRREPLAGPA